MKVRIAALVAVLVAAGCSGAPPSPQASNVRTAESSVQASPTPRATPSDVPTPSSSPAPQLVAAPDVGTGPCAMAELDGSVWVTNYSANTIVRVDGETNTVVEQVSLGAGAQP